MPLRQYLRRIISSLGCSFIASAVFLGGIIAQTHRVVNPFAEDITPSGSARGISPTGGHSATDPCKSLGEDKEYIRRSPLDESEGLLECFKVYTNNSIYITSYLLLSKNLERFRIQDFLGL